MKYQTLGFYILSSVAIVANCQSLDPAWGIGAYGGDIGLWYPRSSTSTILDPVPTSTDVRASKKEKPTTLTTSRRAERTSASGEVVESTSTTSSEIESTTTTTKYITRTTTITIPVTMSPPPAV
ncbi:hypothetical protein TWF506_000890 [Arthrobotrys conoides]|uniref:Uncharacterized protein n=1 Tax=Arthrobotrys conoides TaxID=74498 RepID=A0AAN8NWR1_9PEZI